jgi:hypothetical protein
MDFEYTSEERKAVPAWLQDQDMAEPPRKRQPAVCLSRPWIHFADQDMQEHSLI